MDTWFIMLICTSLCIAVVLKALFSLLSAANKPTNSLPPCPYTIPLIANFLWLRKSFFELEHILRALHAKLGPMVTVYIGHSPVISISDGKLTHQALVNNATLFASRPPLLATNKIISGHHHKISTTAYGPTWRVMRRNLTAKLLHPSCVNSYASARTWVLQILIDGLKSQSSSRGPVLVADHFQYAVFCLLVFMCFGDRLDQKQIKDIENAQHTILVNYSKFNILNLWPQVTKILFRKQWQEFLELRQNQEDVLIPLIRARKKIMEVKLKKTKEDQEHDDNNQYILSYVDTLLDLQLPEEKRKLDDEEMVSLCSEFLNVGTDSTSTALQWIMANLVKYPEIQEKLFQEIKGVMREEEKLVKEEDLQNMPYLKAVILEGLRRHPPAHFLLPHTVTEDTELGGYLVPKNAIINFMVADICWDSKVWEDPMRFKPERFLRSENGVEVLDPLFDITGSKEIKMMPFGAGRRICPGHGLAILHLEYFVANLIWSFKWSPPSGDDVNLEEKLEFTIIMRDPLKALICSR